ncbi:hypothetical protein [Pendulispora albinea]|uniref:Uncharacterized protein n=1 Tax=Pendulispora albinea TaxID=2741071 RepID=A0ABZ2M8F8_9BACT
MNRRGIVVIAALLVALVALVIVVRACAHRFAEGSEAGGHASRGPGSGSGDAAGPRCVRAGSVILGNGLSRGGLLVGEAVAAADGYAVGVIRAVGKERRSMVARVSSNGERVTFVDVGPALGELPPPLPFVQRGALFAASYVRSAAQKGLDAPRTLAIVRIGDARDGKAAPFAEIPQQSDESMALDVATSPEGRAIVVWDEDATPAGAGGPSPAAADAPRGGPPPAPVDLQRTRARGVIKVLPVPNDPVKGDPNGSPAIVSSSGADVERPRAIARAGGYWVAWIARRLDPRGESDPKALEGPGEDRSYAWVEMAKVDDGGKRVGDVRRVTSDAGHATAFDWVAGEGGKLDLFVRDDAEMSQEGDGGRILRIAVREDGPQAPEAMVGAGVGLGDPAALGGPGGRWLFYADIAEHTHGIFLDSAVGVAVAPATEASTLEPLLDGKSPLLGTLEARNTLVLAVGPATADPDVAEAHILRCEALNR